MIHEDYAIGTSFGGLTLLNELNVFSTPYGSPVTRPHWAFQDGGVFDLDDGSQRVIGLPKAQWRWDIITDDEREALRTFCPGVSAEVYISTYNNDDVDTVHSYRCVLLWPTDKGEIVQATYRTDFEISFVNLVEVTS